MVPNLYFIYLEVFCVCAKGGEESFELKDICSLLLRVIRYRYMRGYFPPVSSFLLGGLYCQVTSSSKIE